LVPRFFQRTGAIDLFGCVAQLFFDGKLRCDAAAGICVAQPAGTEAFELLLGAAPGDHEPVQFFVKASFHQERCLNKRSVAGSIARPLIELPMRGRFHTRMSNGVEAIELGAVGEYSGCQFSAIDVTVGLENSGAKFAHDFVVSGLAGLN
jgi:hypothetical protein